MSYVIKGIHEYKEGRVAYMDANGKWGFLDEYGNVVVSPIFYDVSDFDEGMAYTNYVDEKYNEYKNYINKDGKSINKRGYSSEGKIHEGFGLVAKKPFGSNRKKYFLTDSEGDLIPLDNIEYNANDAIKRIHNGIIIGRKSDVYKIERDGIKIINNFLVDDDHKHIENFELNPVDNKLYSIMSSWDDGAFYENSIIDEECNKIISSTTANYIRLNDKYYMSRTETGGYVETSIFYINGDSLDESKLITYIYNEKEDVVDAKVIDYYIILTLANGHKKAFSLGYWSYVDNKEYEEIYYEKGYNYLICKDSNNIYHYFDEDRKCVKKVPELIIFKNGIGVLEKKEVFDESNSSYSYNKYYIFDESFNLITSYPNEYLDLKLKELQHVGNILLGKSLFNERTYIINTENNFNISYFDNYSYEYFGGYFIVYLNGKYNLIDINGNYALKDCDRIINIGENKLLVNSDKIVHIDMLKNLELEFDYSNLPYIIYNDNPNIVDINLKYIYNFVELLDAESNYIMVPISTKEEIEPYKYSTKETLNNINVPVNSINYNALINKKDLIHQLRIDQEDLLVYHREMRENPEYVWSENNSTFYKYKEHWTIRDCYKKYLKYFNLSKYNLDGVDISYTDFTDSNVKIDPKNRDLRGVILHDYNLEKSYMAKESYYEGCITDENTCIIRHTKDGEIRYYFNENKDVKVLQLINNQ